MFPRNIEENMHIWILAIQLIWFIWISDCLSICPVPYSCVSLKECGQKLNSQGSLTSILFRCNEPSSAKISVCCPPYKETKKEKEKEDPSLLNDRITEEKLSNLELFPSTCGIDSNNKIINGDNATLRQFPWMALLGFTDSDTKQDMFLCGGSLINERYILTAAHCFQTPDSVKLTSVRLGELDLRNKTDCIYEGDDVECAPPPEDVEVEHVIIHDEFSSGHLKNDIALVRLKRKIEFNDYIRPICLPFVSTITGEEEKKYTVIGWGKVDNFLEEGSPNLQFAKVVSTPVSECNELQPQEVKPIDHTQLCAGGNLGKDACKGDSGGPLVDVPDIPHSSELKYVQIGIVSFGYKTCGAQEVPTVYTRVSSFIDWILHNMEP